MKLQKSTRKQPTTTLEFYPHALSVHQIDGTTVHWLDWQETKGLDAIDLDSQQQLAQQLKSLKPNMQYCVAAISRSQVCMHLIELPRLESNQLKDAVAIQVESIYAENSEQYAFAYQIIDEPMESNPGVANSVVGLLETQLVLIVTLPKSLVNAIVTLCQKAQIPLSHLFVRELLWLQSLDLSRTAVHQVISYSDRRWYVGLAVGNQMIQFQHLPMGLPLNGNLIQGWFRRLRRSLPTKLQDLPEGRTLIMLPAQDFEKSRELQQVCHDLGLDQENATLLVSPTDHLVPTDVCGIDLLPEQPHPGKLSANQFIVITCLLLLACVALWIYQHRCSTAKIGQLEAISLQCKQLEDQLVSLADRSTQVDLLQRWQSAKISWGTELSRLSATTANSKGRYLYRLQMDSSMERPTPTIQIDGRAVTVNDAIQWSRELSDDAPEYSVLPQILDRSTADPEFPIVFKVQAQLYQDLQELNDE